MGSKGSIIKNFLTKLIMFITGIERFLARYGPNNIKIDKIKKGKMNVEIITP